MASDSNLAYSAGGSGDDSLGIYAKYVSALDDSAQIDSDVEASFDLAAYIREQYQLLKRVRQLLPHERTAKCLHDIAPLCGGVTVDYLPETSRGKFHNLQVCKSVWVCPVCSSIISEQRRNDLKRMLEAARAKHARALLITLTARHTRSDSLYKTLDGLLGAVRSMLSHRRYRNLKQLYGIIGFVRATEVTHSTANGWHPHCHILLFLPDDVPDGDLRLLSQGLRHAWEEALRRKGMTCNGYGFDLRATDDDVADYIAKYGRDPSGRWGPESELTKANVKRGRAGSRTPWDLLRLSATGDKQASALFVEYAKTMKGRRQLQQSDLLSKLLLGEAEKTDEECVDASEAAQRVTLAFLRGPGWRQVIKADARADVQMAAGTGDTRAVVDALLDAGVCEGDFIAFYGEPESEDLE